MPTVTIGGVDYDCNVDLDTADAYAAANPNADDYRALDSDGRGRCIVTGTRLIDRQSWLGAPTTAGQVHAFPRTGLVDKDGNDVSSATVPQQVEDANCELAIALAADAAAAQNDPTVNDRTRVLKAGSVQIEYFRNLAKTGRFPLPAMELVGLWLANGAGLQLAESSGTSKCSEFTRGLNFTRGI